MIIPPDLGIHAGVPPGGGEPGQGGQQHGPRQQLTLNHFNSSHRSRYAGIDINEVKGALCFTNFSCDLKKQYDI